MRESADPTVIVSSQVKRGNAVLAPLSSPEMEFEVGCVT